MKTSLARTTLITHLLIFAIALPSLSWASPLELIILLDLSPSCSAVVDENKKGVEFILATLPEGACVKVLFITEASFSNARKMFIPNCIPESETIIDRTPFDARKRIVNEWQKLSHSLKADALGTDVFGAICRAARLVPKTGESNKNRMLIIFSDLRHNTDGINIETVTEVPQTVLDKVREKMLIPSLKGVRVWVLGFHTRNKSTRYISSLQTLWERYFQEVGARVMAFTEEFKWSPGGDLKKEQP